MRRRCNDPGMDALATALSLALASMVVLVIASVVILLAGA